MRNQYYLFLVSALFLSGCATSPNKGIEEATYDCAGAKLIPAHIEQPAYPDDARFNDIEGWVQMMFDLERNGLPSHVAVTESSHPVFNDPAVVAFKLWRFEPVKVSGKPAIHKSCTYTMMFELEE